MSTRGCVAIGTLASWRGVYNHWDSYPTGLGQQVWQHLQSGLANGKTLEEFACELLTYDDWRAYLNKGICEYCGKRTTQPHTISGVIFSPRLGEKFETKDQMRRFLCSLPAWKGRYAEIRTVIEREWQIRANIKHTRYPDPEAKYHQHDIRPVEEQHITSKNPDPLFIEWVYIIDPQGNFLYVLGHRYSRASKRTPWNETPKPSPCRRPLHRGCNGVHWHYSSSIWWHELAGHFPINGTEPNWEALEAKAR